MDPSRCGHITPDTVSSETFTEPSRAWVSDKGIPQVLQRSTLALQVSAAGHHGKKEQKNRKFLYISLGEKNL